MADDLFEGMDAPRPLPDALRSRLEEQLLGAVSRPLDPSLDARLEARLSDPVSGALDGLDDPRALSGQQRARLESVLVRRRRTPWLAGAAAAALLVLGGALVLDQRAGSPDQLAGRSATAPPSAADATGGGTTGGTTTGATGQPGSGFSTNEGSTGGGGVVGDGTQQSAPLPAPRSTSADAAVTKSTRHPRVSPGSGPASGGTLVTISPGGLSTAVGVLFGPTPGDQLVVRADGSLTVRAPAGSPGVVDVTVQLSEGGRLVFAQAFAYVAE